MRGGAGDEVGGGQEEEEEGTDGASGGGDAWQSEGTTGGDGWQVGDLRVVGWGLRWVSLAFLYRGPRCGFSCMLYC